MPSKKRKSPVKAADNRRLSDKFSPVSTHGIILIALLIIGTLICYVPAYWAGYVELDDQMYIRNNIHVNTGLTWTNIQWAFTEVGYASNWHPLTWISHMLDAQLFGTNPAGHHVVNVLIHAINAALLFLVVQLLTGKTWPSFFVAALFAVHPLNVESVAWLAQRKNTLSTFFGLLAIWSYTKYAQEDRKTYFGLSIFWFFSSLLAKPMLVTLPFALLLLDYWPLNRLSPFSGRSAETGVETASGEHRLKGMLGLLAEKLPYLLLAIAVSLLTLLAQKDAINPLEKLPIADRLANVSIAYMEYLRLMVWPTSLAVFYPLYAEDYSAWQTAGAIAILAGVTAVAIWLRRRFPYVLVGWLWYLGTMVPVIGIVQVGAQAYADRYTYVPFWGLWLALVWLASDGIQFFGKSPLLGRAAGTLAGILLVVLGYLTFRQTEKWHDSVTLFESAIENTEKNWMAHKILANHYLMAEQYDRAIWHCRQPLTWGREYPMMYSTFGRALFEMGYREEGLQKMQQAIHFCPDSPSFHANLGWSLVASGRFQEAIDSLAKAAETLSSQDDPYTQRIINANWGIALTELGQPIEGLEKLERALAREPGQADLLRAAAQIDFQLKEYHRGRQRLVQIIQLHGLDISAYELLAQSFIAEENWKEAAAVYEALIEAVPEHYEARFQMAGLLVKLNQLDIAIAVLRELDKELTDVNLTQAKLFLNRVHLSLAEIYQLKGDPASARSSAMVALEMAEKGNDTEVVNSTRDQVSRYQNP